MEKYIFKEGVFVGKKILNIFEGLSLLEENKIEVTDINSKNLSFNDIYNKLPKKLRIAYDVYRELTKKGYIVGSGMKFGGYFRVYDKAYDKHSRWVCYPINIEDSTEAHEMLSKNRVAHSTRKTLLLAIKDNNRIIFVESKWKKM